MIIGWQQCSYNLRTIKHFMEITPFLVCKHAIRRSCWWLIQQFFFRRIYMKISHHTNEKELELKCIPKLSLGLLLGTRQSAIFFPFLVWVPKVFAKSHSLSFSFLNGRLEFSSQSREMLLFVATNMATMTSSANQQYFSPNYFYIIFPFKAYLNHLRRCLKIIF